MYDFLLNNKYFIGYKGDNHKVKSLHIILAKNEILCKSLNAETKWMNSFIETEELFEKFNGAWNKVSNNIKEELEFEPILFKILRS